MPEATAVWFPNSVINKCPATIFAMRRTERVIGRITFLIDSMSTINGIRAVGVLWGTKWANMWLVLFTHPKIINLNHRGNAKVSVRVMCLEAVKIYGNKPKKLFITIKINKAINMKEEPWKAVGPSRVLNSLWSLITVLFIIRENFLGVNQKIGSENVKINNELNQLRGRLKLAAGSKTLNKFVIMFRG